MTDWLVAGLVCLGFVWAGWPWARSIPAGDPGRAGELALAYLAGTALVTLAMLGVAFLGLPLNRVTVLLSFVVVRFLRSSRRELPQLPKVPGSTGWPARAAIVGVCATLAFGVVQAFRLGHIDSTDFMKAWGLKGLAAAHDHSLDFAHLSGPNLFYPLEISNVNAAVLIALGHVDDAVLRLPAALFGIALPITMWWMLRLVLPPTAAAAAIALAVMTPEFTRQMTDGLADLALAGYLTICVLAAYLWLLDQGAAWASLSGFAAGAAAWTKVEGAFSCLVVLAAVVIVRRTLRVPGIRTWIGWFALFVVPWLVFQRLHGIPANRSHFKSLHLNLAWIVRHVADTLAETAHWGLFWPLCIGLICITAPLWWRTDVRLLAAVTLPNVVLTLAAYVTHYRGDQSTSISATAQRLYVHLAPTIAVMAVAGFVAASVARRAVGAGDGGAGPAG